MNPNEFYSFRAAADDPDAAELMIFSQIGEWEDMGDVSARAFARDLAQLPSSVKRLDIHINSPGGSVFEAQGIYSRLADHRSTKHVYVDGLAASAASIIAMVGHRIYIRANASMMIHLPSGLAMGNADDMRHMATALDSITESMINVYAKRTNLKRDEIRSLLAAETWMHRVVAVDKGFADEVRGVVKAAAIVGEKKVIINGVEHDLSRFHNIPAFTAAATNNERTKPMNPTKPNAGAGTETPPADPPANQPPPAPPAAPPHQPPTPPTAPPPPNTAPTPPPAPPAATTYEGGIAAERARVTALQKLDKPATHDIIVAAIRDGKQVTDIVEDITNALEKATQRDARRTDASILTHIPPSGEDGGEGTNAFAASLKKSVQKRAASARPNYSRN